VTASRKPLARSLVELVLIVAVALGLALIIQAFVVKPYRIPSGSMLPTLHINQRVLVDRIGEHFYTPHVGDIIVFHPPKDYNSCANPSQGENAVGEDAATPCDTVQGQASSVTFIKRVVGLPGDRLSIRNGEVIRNGVPETDPYAVPCYGVGSCTGPRAFIVPRGDYYMMGDNRPDSEDSRFWGPVPRKWIIGKAFFTYWPPDRIGFL
jgi:signal peptidase I